MAPGLLSAGGWLPPKEEALEKGTVVAIAAEGKEYVCGVGVLAVGTEEMKEKGKGGVLTWGGWVGDGIWGAVG